MIQGSAADLIKLAMINIHRRLRAEKWSARMLLQIHDELVFEAPPEEVERLVENGAARNVGRDAAFGAAEGRRKNRPQLGRLRTVGVRRL